MKPKSSIWNIGRETNNARDLLRYLNWRRTCNKIEIENTTNGIVFEILTLSIIDFDFNTIRVEKYHAMCTILTTVINIRWMSTVEVASCRNTVSISIPDGSSVVSGVKSKCIRMFTFIVC